MGKIAPAEPITWQQLKDFVNSLDEQHLNKNVAIDWADESYAKPMNEPFIIQNDIYMYDDNDEDCATLEELREIHKYDDEPFDESLLKLITPKGTPFLWMDF